MTLENAANTQPMKRKFRTDRLRGILIKDVVIGRRKEWQNGGAIKKPKNNFTGRSYFISFSVAYICHILSLC